MFKENVLSGLSWLLLTEFPGQFGPKIREIPVAPLKMGDVFVAVAIVATFCLFQTGIFHDVRTLIDCMFIENQ